MFQDFKQPPLTHGQNCYELWYIMQPTIWLHKLVEDGPQSCNDNRLCGETQQHETSKQLTETLRPRHMLLELVTNYFVTWFMLNTFYCRFVQHFVLQ